MTHRDRLHQVLTTTPETPKRLAFLAGVPSWAAYRALSDLVASDVARRVGDRYLLHTEAERQRLASERERHRRRRAMQAIAAGRTPGQMGAPVTSNKPHAIYCRAWARRRRAEREALTDALTLPTPSRSLRPIIILETTT